MSEPCMFNILALPEDDLKRVLPKASTRSLAKLVVAYPRAVSKTFMSVLTDCLSTATIQFLKEELDTTRPPSFPEIRQAESELMKIIRDEHLEDHVFPAQPPTEIPK
jgi:hypothetical protein